MIRHPNVTVENTAPFNYILYQILHFTTTKFPFLGIFVILAHFRYEIFFSRVWKKYENSHLEAASLIHNQQNNNSISKTFVDYIPLLKNQTMLNRLKFTIEFFIYRELLLLFIKLYLVYMLFRNCLCHLILCTE